LCCPLLVLHCINSSSFLSSSHSLDKHLLQSTFTRDYQFRGLTYIKHTQCVLEGQATVHVNTSIKPFMLKVHLTLKIFSPSNKSSYHLKHFVTNSFCFGLSLIFCARLKNGKSAENRHHFGSGLNSEGMGLVTL